MNKVKPMKRWTALLLLTLMVACGGGAANSTPEVNTAVSTPVPAPTTPTTTTGMRAITSTQLAAQMGVGWNLGNSLEAIGGETAWGNARTTQQMIDAVKAAGFKTIRIPVAWKQYADASDTISPVWMARVTEVVGYAKAAGLIAIINVHWDGGWLQPTYAKQKDATDRLTKYWTQIAINFKGFDDTLLFAGTNEVMVEGDYGTPTAEYVAVQNGFNQTFVNAVRATGGNNAVRHLVVQGFNTNIDHTLAFAVLPKDSATQRLMMEVHYYDPYNFTLNDKSGIWQWGAGATDPKATETWANEAYTDAQFQKMKTRFADAGVPVIVGEFSAMARTTIPGAEAYRQAWDQYISKAATSRGMVPVYWDAGATGNGGSGLFNRATGQPVYPALIGAIVNGGK